MRNALKYFKKNGDFMTQEIENDKSDGETKYVNFAHSTHPTKLTVQQYQAIYNEITGKTEKLSLSGNSEFILTDGELEQLNKKMIQILEQFQVVAMNCNITVFHKDSNEDSFSSFERYQVYNRSNNDPITKIFIVYNFSILLPQLEKSQNYKISINLRSGVLTKKDMAMKMPKGIFRMIAQESIRVDIEYIDYLIAKTFSTHIKDWMEGLEKVDTNSLGNFFRDKAEWSIPIFKYLFSSSIAYSTILFFYNYKENNNEINLEFVTLFIPCVISILYVSLRIGMRLGYFVEYAIDDTVALSYIKINKGDEKLFKINEKARKNSKWKAIGSITFTFLLSLLASLVANSLTVH